MKSTLTLNIIYWLATAIVLFLLGYAFVSYHLYHDAMASFFTALGYPTYLVYPLAWLKLITFFVIVTHRYNDLRDMVYAAYFLNMIMALTGHAFIDDSYTHALAGAIALIVSYLLGNRVRGRPRRNFFGRFTHPVD